MDKLELFAWVGEEELNSGEFYIQKGLFPSGLLPLVSTKEDIINEKSIKNDLQKQVDKYGIPVKLCRFVFSKEVMVLNPGVGNEDSYTSES